MNADSALSEIKKDEKRRIVNFGLDVEPVWKKGNKHFNLVYLNLIKQTELCSSLSLLLSPKPEFSAA